MEWTLIIALAALLASALAVGLVVDRLRAMQGQIAALRAERHRLLEDIEGLSAGAVSHGERVARLERELRRLKERLSSLGSRESSSEVFEQAIRMARRGARSDEIARACGLSQVEADLVVLIHQDEAS